MKLVTVTALVRDEGTVVTFETEDGQIVGVDHRAALLIAEHLPCEVEIEEWQILGSGT